MTRSFLYGERVRLVLPGSARPERVADDCRTAALRFVNEAAALDGWGARELALWIARDYREATRWARAGLGVDVESIAPDGDHRAVIRASRWRVLAELETLVMNARRVPFVERSLGHELVLPCETAHGERGWIAADRPHVQLRDRVLALFAVDYLVRGETYRELAVCHHCERVAFDAEACACSARLAPARTPHVATRRGLG